MALATAILKAAMLLPHLVPSLAKDPRSSQDNLSQGQKMAMKE